MALGKRDLDLPYINPDVSAHVEGMGSNLGHSNLGHTMSEPTAQSSSPDVTTISASAGESDGLNPVHTYLVHLHM